MVVEGMFEDIWLSMRGGFSALVFSNCLRLVFEWIFGLRVRH
jgi:hypothetical protein